MSFAIKAEIRDTHAGVLIFSAQKTMYSGKKIARGDTIFIFASENEGGQGLIARGIVTAAKACPKASQMRPQVSRTDITIERTAVAKRPLGLASLCHSKRGTIVSRKLKSTSNCIVRRQTR